MVAQNTTPGPTPLEEISDAIRTLTGLEAATTDPPWWFDNSDDCWRLHGTYGWTPAGLGGAIPPQPVNRQILKAPKRGTDYAEYWPSPADAQWIITASPALIPVLLRILKRAQTYETYDCAEEGQSRDALELARLVNQAAKVAQGEAVAGL